MLIDLPIWTIIALNVTGWPVIQMTIAWLMFCIPYQRFDAAGWLFRPRTWEQGGKLYSTWFATSRWKHHLPDAAPWFQDGFAKAKVDCRKPENVSRFLAETCRAEIAHWLMLLPTPIFFLWNPLWADPVIIAYAVFANVPCILVQRQNRARLVRLTNRGKTPV